MTMRHFVPVCVVLAGFGSVALACTPPLLAEIDVAALANELSGERFLSGALPGKPATACLARIPLSESNLRQLPQKWMKRGSRAGKFPEDNPVISMHLSKGGPVLELPCMRDTATSV